MNKPASSASTGPWYVERRFARYWTHYEQCRRWKDRHRVVRERIQSNPPPLPPVPSWLVPEPPTLFDDESADDTASSSDAVEDVGEEVEADAAEMSEEMLAYFRITIQHRIERDRKKKMEEEQQTKKQSSWIIEKREYESAEMLGTGNPSGSSATFSAPTGGSALEQRRKIAMKLYGPTHCQRVLTAETLMQIRYNHEMDRFKPPVWPNIPLKL